MDLTDPHDRGDAVELVPPVFFPQPTDGHVSVWLDLPAGAHSGRIVRDDGRIVLVYPPGTTADRVETRGTRVVDIRGTRIDADGHRWHHVYRPVDADPGRPLVGVEWPADDPDAGARAADLFVDRLRKGGVRKGLAAVRSKLDCDGCHVPLRPDNTAPGEYGLVARGTDAAGWFVPSTLIAADVPIERYGARDPNADDPYVVPTCAGCPVPRASFALGAALADGDPHATAFCASWRALDDATDHPCRSERP